MIINNTLSEINDILEIQAQALISGTDLKINSFVDSTDGETPNRFFEKSFRYSFDGVNYSDWLELNNLNLQNSNKDKIVGLLYFEFRYKRVGDDAEGILVFNSLELIGNIDIFVVNNSASIGTIFEDIINNDNFTNATATNLLLKIYNSGILAQYVERGKNIDDDDFVSFWSTVALYLSYFVGIINKFRGILQNKQLLLEYVSQISLYFNETIKFDELQYLTTGYYDEVRKRGTKLIISQKGEVLPSGTTVDIDGEYLRLICINRWDEFLFELISREHSGWCIGSSSSCYNGTLFSNQLQKAPELKFEDLSKWKTLNPDFLKIEQNELIIEISDAVNISGLGVDFMWPPYIIEPEYLINVDDNVDYEITFSIKKEQLNDGMLSFRMLGFNKDGINDRYSFLNIRTGIFGYNLLNIKLNTIVKTDEWYFIRGIIYSKESELLSIDDSKLNINKGNALKFNPQSNTHFIYPILQFEPSSDLTEKIKIKDFGIRPLVRGKNAKTHIKNPQFIQSNIQILNWLRNNNTKLSSNDIELIAEEYLIPYQNTLNTIHLD